MKRKAEHVQQTTKSGRRIHQRSYGRDYEEEHVALVQTPSEEREWLIKTRCKQTTSSSKLPMEALGYDNLPLLWLLRAVDVANRTIPYEDAKAQVDLWQEVQAAQPRPKRPKLAPCASADDEEAADGHTTPATSEEVRSDTPCEPQQRCGSQELGAAPRSSLRPAAAAQPAAPVCSVPHQAASRAASVQPHLSYQHQPVSDILRRTASLSAGKAQQRARSPSPAACSPGSTHTGSFTDRSSPFSSATDCEYDMQAGSKGAASRPRSDMLAAGETVRKSGRSRAAPAWAKQHELLW